MKQKFLALVCVCLMLLSMIPMSAHAAGRVIIDGASQVNEGEEYKVVVRCVGESSTVLGNITFKYDTDCFTFVSCDTEGATQSGGKVMVTGKSVTFTLKATAAGDGYVTASATDSNGAEMSAAGIAVTVNSTSSEVPESDEEETPTPEVEEEETDVSEEEEDENEDASTEETQESYLYVDGVMHYVTNVHWDELLNAGYVQENIMINDIMASGLRYEGTNIILVHLINSETGDDAGYFVYDTEAQAVCPNVGYGQSSEDEAKLADIQDNYSKLYEKYEALKQKNRNMLIGIIIGVAVLVIALISFLLIKRFRADDDYEVNYKRTDGGAPLKKQGEYLTAIANNSNEDDDDDFEDEDEEKLLERMRAEAAQMHAATKKNSSWEPDTDDVEIINLEDL